MFKDCKNVVSKPDRYLTLVSQDQALIHAYTYWAPILYALGLTGISISTCQLILTKRLQNEVGFYKTGIEIFFCFFVFFWWFWKLPYLDQNLLYKALFLLKVWKSLQAMNSTVLWIFVMEKKGEELRVFLPSKVSLK